MSGFLIRLVNHGYRACFTDPSGNLFGLWGEKKG
jgi:predicted enzyme related to lactoylglutathione lyase